MGSRPRDGREMMGVDLWICTYVFMYVVSCHAHALLVCRAEMSIMYMLSVRFDVMISSLHSRT